MPASARHGAACASSEGSDRSHRTSTWARSTVSAEAFDSFRASKKASRLAHFFFGICRTWARKLSSRSIMKSDGVMYITSCPRIAAWWASTVVV
jgi:hypothetical protein